MSWALCGCSALASCAGFPEQPVDEDGLQQGFGTPQDPQEPFSSGEADDSLVVDVGDDRAVAQDALVQVEARVINAEEGELFYLWEYTLLDQSNRERSAHRQAAQAEEFVKDWNTLTFYPQDLFPDINLNGRMLRVRARVLELGARRREGFGDQLLTILGQSDTDKEDDLYEELLPINDDIEDDNWEEDGTDNEEENQDDESDEDGEINPDPAPPPNPVPNSEPDPCDGITALSVALPASLSMSLYQGSLNLSPTVCAGTGPYSYDWTPTTYLEDGNGGLGGGPPGSVTSPDADFGPSVTGVFAVTVAVTDADATTESATVTITVDDFDPLIADAGPDAAATQGASLSLSGSAIGGSGNYDYSWSPAGSVSAVFSNVPTGTLGETTYTLTITDTTTSHTASDSVKVVVLAGGASCSTDFDLGVSSGDFVGFDSDFGSAGQAVVVSGTSVVLLDLNTSSIRATLLLPSSGQGLAVDATRGRAYVTTRLSGQFTRSVQVIDLDSAALGSNIGLTANVAAARGLAVVPSSGDVLVAVIGGNGTDGLMVIAGGSALGNAVQNIHHTNSFQQPVSVAVLEQSGLSVAVVANMTGAFLTLVPLSGITFTPDDPSGGGQAQLPSVSINGPARAIAGRPATSQVIIGWNDGDQGRVQIVSLTSNQTASAGADIQISGAILSQGLAIDTSTGQAFAAGAGNGVSVIDLGFAIQTGTLTGTASSALSVATEEGVANRVLIVGNDSRASERCP